MLYPGIRSIRGELIVFERCKTCAFYHSHCSESGYSKSKVERLAKKRLQLSCWFIVLGVTSALFNPSESS